MSSVISVLLSQVICIPFFRRPFQDLANPVGYGMRNAVNVRIPVGKEDEEEQMTIGAWLLSPVGQEENTQEQEESEVNFRKVADGETVILYLHGNAETRSQNHRRELYKVYQEHGLHVLAVDYRGYGDSSWLFPNEETMAEDAEAAFHWLRSFACGPGAKIVVHGHSLGTGVTARLGAILDKQQVQPLAYILESPFNRMLDEVYTFKVSRIFPNVEQMLVDAKVEFDSQKWIREIRQPVLILHAKDDTMVPYSLGETLYESAKDVCKVEMISYDAELGFGHEDIYKDPQFADKIKHFVQNL